ncbi:MAG: ABC transporter permease subunit [Candidatus Zixiibacteriota bacterium]
MSHTMSIFKKELKSYFNSPIAYIVISVFLLVAGWFFASNLFLMKQATLRNITGTVLPMVLFFFVPAITMRLLAEEKKSGTMELLATMPVENTEIIVGKFLAALFLLIIALVLTIPYTITISLLGNPDIGIIISSYIGLILLGSTYLAIGMFASSITRNQIVSFIITFVILLVLFMLDKITLLFRGNVASVMQYISTDFHFKNISRGVLDSKDLIYFLSMIVMFLFFTNISLDSLKR